MLGRLRSFLRGTGGATWVFHLAVFSVAFYVVLPGGSVGLAPLLAGVFSAIRVEMNDYRRRIERMEGERAASPADHAVTPAAIGRS